MRTPASTNEKTRLPILSSQYWEQALREAMDRHRHLLGFDADSLLHGPFAKRMADHAECRGAAPGAASSSDHWERAASRPRGHAQYGLGRRDTPKVVGWSQQELEGLTRSLRTWVATAKALYVAPRWPARATGSLNAPPVWSAKGAR
jgi:hypothetical protein